MDENEVFQHENLFYQHSHPSRIGKLLTHYELYKSILHIPGDIVECGVFKGASLIRFATFRSLLENTFSRKIIGFDSFGAFPETSSEADRQKRCDFVVSTGGGNSIAKTELDAILSAKKFDNIELIQGNLLATAKEYTARRPELRISLLHIDVDVADATQASLDAFANHVIPGGTIIFDDYGVFPGTTNVIDEFCARRSLKLKRLPISHNIPAYTTIV